MTIGSNGLHKLSGSPVLKRDVEKASRPACSDIITYRLSDEELEYYRSMGNKRNEPVDPFKQAKEAYLKLRAVKSRDAVEADLSIPAFWCGLSKETLKQHIPIWEAEIMSFTLTREQYLTERKGGKTRAQIAREQGITAPSLLHHLGKWGIKDSVVEERELAKMRESSSVKVDDPVSTPKELVHHTPPTAPAATSPVDEKQDNEPKLVQSRPTLEREVTVTVKLEEKFIMAAFEAVTDEVHQIAVDHGWHEPPVPLPVQLALIHSEVSECLEADRKHEGDGRVAEELADVIIRAMDTAAAHKLDLAGALFNKIGKNRDREHRHGGRKY